MEEKDTHAIPVTMEETWSPGSLVYFGTEMRTIAIWYEITYENVLPTISQLLELNAIDPKKEITIWLCTEGGSLSAALALYDTIRMIESKVIIYTSGICASAGLLILAAGDERYSTENTQFFYHQPVMPAGIDLISAEMVTETANSYVNQQVNYDELLMKRCKIKKSIWKKHFAGKIAKYFTPAEAHSYGFIDGVTKKGK